MWPFFDRLLEAETAGRYEREVAMKTKLAHFPLLKTLDQFDFSFQPSVPEKQVRELATMRFVAHGENVLLLGPPGVGKTHLAISLGIRAIAQSLSVYFVSIVELWSSWRATRRKTAWRRAWRRYASRRC